MKIEKRNFLHFLSFLLAALMIFSLTPLSVYAADRSVTPKYDFSSVDDINIYDTYEKRETATGIGYVRVGKQHFYDWNNPSAFESARYGSFLRNNEETQFFEIGNAPFSSQLDLNILTIYADPEVKFSMTDYYGNFVVDSEGNYNKDKVSYYNRTTDNGHNVYFIDLVPAGIQDQWQMIQFYTSSTTSQPHYSFWFGNPLMETNTVTGNLFTLTATSPNRTSPWVTVKGPTNVPARSWVLNVTVERVSSSGDSYVQYTTPSLALTLPNGRNCVDQIIRNPPLIYEGLPSSSKASPVKGNYKLRIEDISQWNKPTTSNVRYSFTGRMSVEYIYAFGA